VALGGYTDLFAAGLGFDIAGAYLLAQGLLTCPKSLSARLATSQHSTSWANVRAAEDYASGMRRPGGFSAPAPAPIAVRLSPEPGHRLGHGRERQDEQRGRRDGDSGEAGAHNFSFEWCVGEASIGPSRSSR
jgi:hypothetical protein